MSPALLDKLATSKSVPNSNGSACSTYDLVIVGGGTAGISVAARLRRARPDLSLAVIEPSATHYYQPLWTLVGGGVFSKESSARSQASVIPPGATWLQDAVTTFLPEENALLTRDGQKVVYRHLIVAAGIQSNWNVIEGLATALGKGGVCSNYSFQHVDYTWRCIRELRGGRAIFSHPSTAVKCGGAPQKIMYLADETFRKNGVRDRCQVIFASANNYLFQVKRYEETLYRVVKEKGIDLWLEHELTEIRPERKEAVFINSAGEKVVSPYDLLHVTPPMGPPDFIRQSPLANAAGWVDVDAKTLRHTRYPKIFGIGDASSLPTSKTGAAVRKQAPVLVDQLLATLEGRPAYLEYDGYTSCPLVTGYGKLVLAEFDYDKKPKETFPFDQSKERYSMWLLKAYAMPQLYWHGMLKGRL